MRMARPGEPRPVHARLVRWLLFAATLAVLEVCARAGMFDPLALPAPAQILSALLRLARGEEFYTDLGRTMVTVVAAFGIGVVGGLPVGVVFWKLPLLGDVFEPYLVTMYALPTLVFYPILLAVMGLGPAPIITIASVMALIPIALNTMVALRSIPPMLPKLGRSVGCSTAQLYRKVLVPAATPLAVPGLRLGFAYAVIGTVAMEFILAVSGLGFRAGYHYRYFDVPEMYAEVLVIGVLAVLFNALFGVLERRIRRDML
ncbi:MAG TPA: ABC transporter permease [Micromonosporaceae bacterium]|nr:ABC transporter permease [Micromonosporaceae bacterium]